jgi:hypothetical protein
MATQFKGIINLDIRDSTPDWSPCVPDTAPEGSPNVLYVIIDDTGIAAWDTFGGLIEMANAQPHRQAGAQVFESCYPLEDREGDDL